MATGTVKILAIGGGGAGGSSGGTNRAGGGGAGGLQYDASHSVAFSTVSVVVGVAGTPSANANGGNGGDSTFDTITATGGGGGMGLGGNGKNGGCGGGSLVYNYTGGTGSQGGAGGDCASAGDNGAGGGGASAKGGNGTSVGAGAGGNGTSNSITGGAVVYAGGGGGGGGGNGGTGGGGNGAIAGTDKNGFAGTDGLGGGGGGSSGNYGGNPTGGSGGKGVVIIAYKTDGSDGVSSGSTGGTKTTSGGYTIHTFTSSDTFTAYPSTLTATLPTGYINLLGSNISQDTGILIDSQTAGDYSFAVGNPDAGSAIIGIGKTFTGIKDKLADVVFFCQKVGSPTGTVVAKLYTAGGTTLTNGYPVGSPLATSGSIDISTISGTANSPVTFTFTGADKYLMQAGVRYVITIEFTLGTHSNSNYINVFLHSVGAGTGYGSAYITSWSNYSTWNLKFYLYGDRINLLLTIPTAFINLYSPVLTGLSKWTNQLKSAVANWYNQLKS